jgi:hypothetical protein
MYFLPIYGPRSSKALVDEIWLTLLANPATGKLEPDLDA